MITSVNYVRVDQSLHGRTAYEGAAERLVFARNLNLCTFVHTEDFQTMTRESLNSYITMKDDITS